MDEGPVNLDIVRVGTSTDIADAVVIYTKILCGRGNRVMSVRVLFGILVELSFFNKFSHRC